MKFSKASKNAFLRIAANATGWFPFGAILSIAPVGLKPIETWGTLRDYKVLGVQFVAGVLVISLYWLFKHLLKKSDERARLASFLELVRDELASALVNFGSVALASAWFLKEAWPVLVALSLYALGFFMIRLAEAAKAQRE